MLHEPLYDQSGQGLLGRCRRTGMGTLVGHCPCTGEPRVGLPACSAQRACPSPGKSRPIDIRMRRNVYALPCRVYFWSAKHGAAELRGYDRLLLALLEMDGVNAGSWRVRCVSHRPAPSPAHGMSQDAQQPVPARVSEPGEGDDWVCGCGWRRGQHSSACDPRPAHALAIARWVRVATPPLRVQWAWHRLPSPSAGEGEGQGSAGRVWDGLWQRRGPGTEVGPAATRGLGWGGVWGAAARSAGAGSRQSSVLRKPHFEPRGPLPGTVAWRCWETSS